MPTLLQMGFFVGTALFVLSIGGIALRWRVSRSECCRRCSHPIADGQGGRCVEFGVDVTAPRNRRFEPPWVRVAQIAVGLLALGVVIASVVGHLGRMRQRLRFDSQVNIQWPDDTYTTLTSTVENLAEADGSQPIKPTEVQFSLEVKSRKTLQFRLLERGGVQVIEVDGQERPATEQAVNELLGVRGGIGIGPERDFFAKATWHSAQELRREQRIAWKDSSDGQTASDAVLQSDIGAVGAGSRSVTFTSLERYYVDAKRWALIIAAAGVVALLMAAFVPRPIGRQ